MSIETLDDIIDEILNKFGIYNGHNHEIDNTNNECHCRCCESVALRSRIIEAVEVEKKLNG